MNVFSAIYRANAWNGVESLSGPGSGTAATSVLAATLPGLVRRLGAKSVLSVGCGDDYWMPHLGPAYLGIDVAPEAIARAKLNHPERTYMVMDAVKGELPDADLVIVRDVLQHLSPADGVKLLDHVTESSARWLLASTYSGTSGECRESGGYWCPDLRDPPFGMPKPVRVMPDGYDYAVPGAMRDPSKLIALWTL
jgi:hypothetical protein